MDQQRRFTGVVIGIDRRGNLTVRVADRLVSVSQWNASLSGIDLQIDDEIELSIKYAANGAAYGDEIGLLTGKGARHRVGVV